MINYIMSNKTKSIRSRNFTCVVYPESAPEGWREALESFHVPFAVSPLHDKDVNPTGEVKKSHWHLYIEFDSLKTLDQANDVVSCTGGTVCQIVNVPRALIRYFVHADNPDKAQYDKSEIECHCGYDYGDAFKTSNRTRYDLLKAILSYIVDADVTEYEDIVVYAMHNEPDWFEALADSCTFMVNSFIKSRRHRKERDG